MAKTVNTRHTIQEAPRYTASEAAHYLRMPVSTVRAWSFGQTYESKEGIKHFRSVIELADRNGKKLSFINLVELFVLDCDSAVVLVMPSHSARMNLRMRRLN